MKDLIFSISMNNHTFKIRTNLNQTLCFYEIKNKYSTSLTFASNTIARISYKNIIFSGTVTKRNNWNLYLDSNTVACKKYDKYSFLSSKPDVKDTEKSLDDFTVEYPNNTLHLYNQLIDIMFDQYVNIENKDELKHQLCKYLGDFYYDIDNLEEIQEYENYADVGPDEEPIIEEISIKEEILMDLEEFFVSFKQSELDNKDKEVILTLDNIIKEFPKLNDIPIQFLHKEFSNYIDKNYDNLISLDIYYNRSVELYEIGEILYDSYQHLIFMNSLEDRIDNILSFMNLSIDNKEEIYSHFRIEYSNSVPTDEEFNRNVIGYIDNYIDFYNLYNKFVSMFDTDNIKINWDEKKIQHFEKYDNKELDVDLNLLAEYEVYQYIMPYYKKHLFVKNSTKYKPVIDKLPSFILYGTSVIDILFENNILINNEDKVLYNEEGDINSAIEQINKITKI